MYINCLKEKIAYCILNYYMDNQLIGDTSKATFIEMIELLTSNGIDVPSRSYHLCSGLGGTF